MIGFADDDALTTSQPVWQPIVSDVITRRRPKETMMTEAQLTIRLTPGTISPEWRQGCVNEIRGGPETLLKWLETQLGLPVPPIHKADRITEYAAALDTVADSVITASMMADRWATASELLARRDELFLAGWDEADSESIPDVVRDLARAVAGRTMTFPGEAKRLRRVLDAVNAGQVLPPHRCVLQDAADKWPSVWRNVLAELTTVEPAELPSHATEGSALHEAQTVVLGGVVANIEQDSTFRYIHTRSESASVEFVAAVLAISSSEIVTHGHLLRRGRIGDASRRLPESSRPANHRSVGMVSRSPCAADLALEPRPLLGTG